MFVARRGKPPDRGKFDRAFFSFRHRGPDHSAISTGKLENLTCPAASVIHWVAGHHRLAILDLDDRSNQPFERDDDLLVFNGEIYNYRDYRRRPEFSDVVLETAGDTEILFRALQNDGYQALNAMNGMWAFAFLDAKRGKILSARDRFGKKPLFWRMDNDQIIFASTLGAIDGYIGRTPRLSVDAARSYLTYGQLFPSGNEETHQSDVFQVAPSGTLTFDLNSWTATTGRYFSFKSLLKPSDEHLQKTLADSLKLRLISERPVGLLLSGGVDSSLILSAAHATGQSDALQFFIGETGKSADAQYANEAIASLGLQAKNVEMGYAGQAFDHFLSVCRHLEKPFPLLGNSMAMGSMYQSVAQHGIRVALDGTGGDELFGGYWDRYFPFAIREAATKRDTKWIATMAGSKLTHLRNLIPFVQKFSGAKTALSSSSIALSSFAKFNQRAVSDPDPLSNTKLSLFEAQYLDVTSGRLGEWLWQNDRNAMMCSIENRSPLLDFRLASHLSSSYSSKFSGDWNKLQLRRQFDNFSPISTQWRVQKQGFRWDRRKFIRENRSELLNVIDGSSVVNDLVHKSRFLDLAHANERVLRSSVGQRLAVLAGLEASTGLRL